MNFTKIISGKPLRKWVLMISILTWAFAPGQARASFKKARQPGGSQHTPRSAPFGASSPNEIIVKFRTDTGASRKSQLMHANNSVVMKTLGAHKNFARVKLTASDSIDSALERYRQDPNVETAEPNYLLHIAVAPNDPLVARQWALKNTGQTVTTGGVQGVTFGTTNGTAGDDLGLQEAWGYITDCRTAKVAVVDSGIQYDHEDLKDNMWNGGTSYPKHGINTVGSGTSLDPRDDNGHGTHVAGIIAARGNNGVGGSGVCWQASLLAAKAGDASGALSTADVIEAIDFAREQGAKVMNMSFSSSENSTSLRDAISEAGTAGIIAVVAAGNESNDNDGKTGAYPCNYDLANIVCVAALDQNFKLATFSNYGVKSVDFAAPGVNVISTWAGTSTSIALSASDSGWNRGTGWGLQTLVDTTDNSSIPVLSNPSNWPSGTYANNLNSTAWKSFSASSGLLSQTLNLTADVTLAASDHFEIAVGSGSQDPFTANSAALLDEYSGETSADTHTYDLNAYRNTAFSIGLKMTSNGSKGALGVGIYDFSIDRMVATTNAYQIEQGTSMAAPYVTGIAAMLFAYNPNYTVADVVEALDQGGVAQSALAGKIRTGKAVNAMGALAHIRAPANVRANVSP